jgi:hypothetical protein
MSDWSWVEANMKEWQERGDEERMRLPGFYSDAFQFRETDPDRAFAIFSEGKQLAEQLHEPWWALFYEKYRIDALIHFKRDYRNVLDMAVQCALEVRKPLNVAFPGRFGIFDSLVAAYLGIDPEGYAKPIQEALDYLEAEIPPGPESDRYLLLARKRIFALDLELYDDAYQACMNELHLASSDRNQSTAIHFATFVYCALCQIAAAKGVWEAVGEYAETGEKLARHVGHECELSEVLAWQAVAALQAGELEKGRRGYRTATAHMDRLQMPPKQGYFDALATYHQMTGDLDKGVKVRDRELESIKDRGRLYYDCKVRIKRCRLLAQLERLGEEDLAAARESARKLRQPDKHLAAIEQLTRS